MNDGLLFLSQVFLGAGITVSTLDSFSDRENSALRRMCSLLVGTGGVLFVLDGVSRLMR